MSLKKIENGFTIKPIKGAQQIPLSEVQGGLFYLNSSILMLARRKSGKTTALGNVLEHCTNKMTKKVFIFSSTIDLDKTWDEIKKTLENKNIEVETFKDIVETDRKGITHNHLKNVMDEMEQVAIEMNERKKRKEENKQRKKEKRTEIKPMKIINYIGDEDDENKEEEEKEVKTKKKAEPFFVVFDDMSHSLHLIEQFLKNGRHYLCKTIVSNQSIPAKGGLTPASRKQFQYYLIWGGFQKSDIQRIYDSSDPDISFEEFYEMYKISTEKKFSFFNYSIEGEYKMNFDYQFNF